jgi:tRNA threonylcarbamoyladenosine biosynthesis protein TsaE
MGIEEYLYNNDWCLIEWPQNVENLLPLEAVKLHLSILENGQRNLQLK